MTARNKAPPAQLSMDALFAEAAFATATAHLPSSIADAVPYYDGLIDRYHAAIMGGDQGLAGTIEDEARDLAIHLNGDTLMGIRGSDDSPCYVLERATAAPNGTIPRWGQTGNFTIDLGRCEARIEWNGLYGICTPMFAARATNYDRPFLSNTGYRSFMAHKINGDTTGITVDAYVKNVINDYINRELKNKLVTIQKHYIDRGEEEDA